MMNPQTKRLFYPDDRVDVQTVFEGYDVPTDDESGNIDVIVDVVVYDRLVPEDLADYCIEIDKENHDRLTDGPDPDIGVTAYDHEETVQNQCADWIDQNVEIVELAEAIGVDEDELFETLFEKVYNRVLEHDQWPPEPNIVEER